DGQRPRDDQEELVFVFVMVPDELASDLHELDEEIVHLSHDLGLVDLGEEGELLRQVHLGDRHGGPPGRRAYSVARAPAGAFTALHGLARSAAGATIARIWPAWFRSCPA